MTLSLLSVPFAAELSQRRLCTEASNCVTANKIIFGSGTELHVNASKLNSFHSCLILNSQDKLTKPVSKI